MFCIQKTGSLAFTSETQGARYEQSIQNDVKPDQPENIMYSHAHHNRKHIQM